MARKPRIHHPAALYHVILRGNEGQEIFFWKEDCFRFYLLLQEGIEHYGYQIHAFCLMTNHVQPFEIDSRILGDRTFIDKVLAGQGQERLKRLVTVDEIVSRVCKGLSIREEVLLDSGKDRRLSKVRAIVAWLVLDSSYLTLSELSRRVNRDSSTLSTAAKFLQKQAKTNTDLRMLMNGVRKDLFEIQIFKA